MDGCGIARIHDHTTMPSIVCDLCSDRAARCQTFVVTRSFLSGLFPVFRDFQIASSITSLFTNANNRHKSQCHFNLYLWQWWQLCQLWTIGEVIRIESRTQCVSEGLQRNDGQLNPSGLIISTHHKLKSYSTPAWNARLAYKLAC